MEHEDATPRGLDIRPHHLRTYSTLDLSKVEVLVTGAGVRARRRGGPWLPCSAQADLTLIRHVVEASGDVEDALKALGVR